MRTSSSPAGLHESTLEVRAVRRAPSDAAAGSRANDAPRHAFARGAAALLVAGAVAGCSAPVDPRHGETADERVGARTRADEVDASVAGGGEPREGASDPSVASQTSASLAGMNGTPGSPSAHEGRATAWGSSVAKDGEDADIATELAALPVDTRGIVLVRDVALVTSLARLLWSVAGGSREDASTGTIQDVAGAAKQRGVTTAGASGGRPARRVRELATAVLGMPWPERRGAIVSWSDTRLRWTLPAEELVRVDPLVAAIAGGGSVTGSPCVVSALRHTWVTCELAWEVGSTPRPPAPMPGAGEVEALREAIAGLARPRDDEVGLSVRAAVVIPGGGGIASARVAIDGPRLSLDLDLPEGMAREFFPFTPRVPTLLAAVGQERSYAWWSAAPSDVSGALAGLPQPLARAASAWTGEGVAVGADLPARLELVLGLDDPGPLMTAMGLLPLADVFGVDLGALLPGWTWDTQARDAFEQRFEVLTLRRAPELGEADSVSAWGDLRRAFLTATVDAAWLGLGVSLDELATSERATRHALRLERGASALLLPEHAQRDLASGKVAALVSLDVGALLDRRAVTAAREAWRAMDPRGEAAWGEDVAWTAASLRSALTGSSQLVLWSCLDEPSPPRSPDVAGPSAERDTSSPGSPRPVRDAGSSSAWRLRMVLGPSGQEERPERDWISPTRVVIAFVAIHGLLLATRPGADAG